MKRYLILLVLVLSTIFYLVNNTVKIIIDFEEEIKEPNIKFGFDLDSFSIKNGTIKEGQVLGEILYLHHIDHNQINRIVKNQKIFLILEELFPVKNIQYYALKIQMKLHRYLFMKNHSLNMSYLILEMILKFI